MTDRGLRELERRWKASGSAADEAAYLLELLRVGELTQEDLELAAFCGDPGPGLASPGVVDRAPGWFSGRLGRVLEGLPLGEGSTDRDLSAELLFAFVDDRACTAGRVLANLDVTPDHYVRWLRADGWLAARELGPVGRRLGRRYPRRALWLCLELAYEQREPLGLPLATEHVLLGLFSATHLAASRYLEAAGLIYADTFEEVQEVREHLGEETRRDAE